MNKKKLQTGMFIVLLLLVSGQIFHNTKVTAINEEIALLEAEEVELQERLFTIKPYIGKDELLNEKIQEEINNLERLNTIIPEGNDTARHVDYLYKIAKQYKVKGHTATFNMNAASEDALPLFYIDVVFEGKQNNLIQVAKKLQSFKDYPYSITDFSLSPIGEGEYILKIKIKSNFSKKAL